jgi:dTDP-glucose 4,6-dehydratase
LVSDYTDPINLGNAEEISMRHLAELIAELAGQGSELRFVDRPVDDPQVRRPDTTVAQRELGWTAQVPVREGLARTIEWFREHAFHMDRDEVLARD